MNHDSGEKATKVLLITDTDWPNLAIMKWSAFYKLQEIEVGFNTANPTIIKVSIVFKKNVPLFSGLELLYPDAEIERGGIRL